MTNIDKTWEKLLDLCEEKNWEWCMSRPVSENISDKHLQYVVVKNQKDEYISYLFNANDPAFYHGHYFTDLREAFEHCENR